MGVAGETVGSRFVLIVALVRLPCVRLYQVARASRCQICGTLKGDRTMHYRRVLTTGPGSMEGDRYCPGRQAAPSTARPGVYASAAAGKKLVGES